MKRVMVIGCPGAGKSTFSRRLQEKTGLPIVYLDNLFWNADKTNVEKAVFLERLESAMQQDAFILDGNYFSSMERRLRACDTVFFLDYPLELCLNSIEERRGKYRPDMPWIEETPDEEFLQFVRDFPENVIPDIRKLLKQHPEKEIHIFHDRSEADRFLAKL